MDKLRRPKDNGKGKRKAPDLTRMLAGSSSSHEVGSTKDTSSVPLPTRDGPWAQYINSEIRKYTSRNPMHKLSDDTIRATISSTLNETQLAAYIREQTGSILEQVNASIKYKKLLNPEMPHSVAYHTVYQGLSVEQQIEYVQARINAELSKKST
jgi:hypothetical protein